MRRNRLRSFAIDAENEEEYIKEYEKTKSRLSQMVFKNRIQEKINEDDKDDLGYQKKQKSSDLNFNDSYEDDYFGLGSNNNNDDDEDNLLYENDEILKNGEEAITNKENSEEKGIEILLNFLKKTIIEELKCQDIKGSTLIFNNNYKNKDISSMSGNAIYDLNIRELIDNILAENDNEYIKSSEGNNNSLRDYIFQNIESDSTLKIMIMANNKNTQNSFMNKFFGISNNNNYIDEEPFEIRKKQIKLFNKNICLQIFNTYEEFHKNSYLISNVYYKTVTAFFIFIESSNHNVSKYLEFIFEKLNKYISTRTVVIFGVNMLYKKDCTIDGFNLREFSDEKDILFIPININNFEVKNSIINNLLNLILIKGIDHKINTNSNRKGSKDKKLGKFKNNLKNQISNDSNNNNKNIYDITKMNVPSSLGYKKKYRINHINAFDMEENDYYRNNNKNKRKLSIDI